MSNDVNWPGWPTEWTPFVQGGEDVIEVIADFPGGNSQQVSLQTAADVTWLKRIRVLDEDHQEMATVTCVDKEHGPVFTVLPQGWRYLEFVKAKVAGEPTGMYQTPPEGRVILAPVDLPAGWRLQFDWLKDVPGAAPERAKQRRTKSGSK